MKNYFSWIETAVQDPLDIYQILFVTYFIKKKQARAHEKNR